MRFSSLSFSLFPAVTLHCSEFRRPASIEYCSRYRPVATLIHWTRFLFTVAERLSPIFLLSNEPSSKQDRPISQASRQSTQEREEPANGIRPWERRSLWKGWTGNTEGDRDTRTTGEPSRLRRSTAAWRGSMNKCAAWHFLWGENGAWLSVNLFHWRWLRNCGWGCDEKGDIEKHKKETKKKEDGSKTMFRKGPREKQEQKVSVLEGNPA